MQKLISFFTSSNEDNSAKKQEPVQNQEGTFPWQEEIEEVPRAEKVFPLKIVKDKESYFTFKVDKVEQNKAPLEWPLGAEELFRMQSECKAKLEDFSHKKEIEANFVCKSMNGVLGAIHFAYINHYPIKLSVSDFILMIGQGLAKHLEIHAEELRKYFVDHEGKEQIVILRPDLLPGQNNDWSTVFGEFSGEIKKRVKTDFYDVVIDDTSVATKITKISSEIALMDVYKQYFEYVVDMGCGFPEMTLAGTPEDWEMLRTKVRRLKELNEGDKLKLDWWLDRLVPLVETMVDQAKTRKVDPSFWGSIYHSQQHRGMYFPTPLISGWINVFQPYLQRMKNQNMEEERCEKECYRSTFGDIHPDNLITGISKVPFTWRDPLGKGIAMNFYGGFLGAKLLEDGTIEPQYFYAVAYEK